MSYDELEYYLIKVFDYYFDCLHKVTGIVNTKNFFDQRELIDFAEDYREAVGCLDRIADIADLEDCDVDKVDTEEPIKTKEELVYYLTKIYIYLVDKGFRIRDQLKTAEPTKLQGIATDLSQNEMATTEIYDLIDMAGYDIVVYADSGVVIIGGEKRFYILDDEARVIKPKEFYEKGNINQIRTKGVQDERL